MVMLRGLVSLVRGAPTEGRCEQCGGAGVVCCSKDEATEVLPFGAGPVKECPACLEKGA